MIDQSELFTVQFAQHCMKMLTRICGESWEKLAESGTEYWTQSWGDQSRSDDAGHDCTEAHPHVVVVVVDNGVDCAVVVDSLVR